MLGLGADERKAVVSLQALVQHGYPDVPKMKLLNPPRCRERLQRATLVDSNGK